MSKTDLFDLYAKISLNSDEYDRDIEEAGKKTEGLGKKIMSGVGKATAAALAAASAAIVSITKNAVEAYAEYEQLVGGVETLFKNSAEAVQRYASNAFKTAGLSANEYMETVTSFSASLLQSLGGDTVAAAEVADMAITDMADNANKMGTSMESIQNAYQGFAKQNYTMLDNLKLGYGGTKEEMERLLVDAEKLSGVEYDISSLSDVYEAIHVVQTELGITGTTAKEAASTISGSVSMMKAAWQNMVVGIADDTQDFSILTDNLVESIKTAADNIIPRIEVALGGVAQLVSDLAPVIAERLPGMLETILPALLEGAMSLANAFTRSLPALLSILVSQMPMIVESVMTIIPQLISAISSAGPELISVAVSILIAFVQSILDNAPMMLTASLELILQLVQGLVNAIPQIIDALPEIIQAIVAALIQLAPELILASVQLIMQLAEGLIIAIPELLEAVPQIIAAVVNGLIAGVSNLIDVGRQFVSGIWEGISSSLQWIKDKISGWVGNVIDFMKNLFGIHSPSTVMRDLIGKNLALGIGEGFVDEMDKVERQMGASMQFELNTGASYARKETGKTVNIYVTPKSMSPAESDYLIQLSNRALGDLI